jgi:class 3 adenylate cyclase
VLLREAFSAHGGREIDTEGDGFFIAFESASSAVSAAVTAQRALATSHWPGGAEIRVRMGLHTAEPHLSDEGYVGVGVHRAARICGAAHGGQIVLSNATAGVVEDAELAGVELVDLGEHRLKDIRRPQRLFQVWVAGLPSRFEPLKAGPQPGIMTFVGTDVSGWSRVIRELGDEATGELGARYHDAVTDVVTAHDGSVLEATADTIVAVFPRAGTALVAVEEIRAMLRAFPWPERLELGVAIAVHSGRSLGTARLTASTALARLTRLLADAEPWQVLVSHATEALVEGDLPRSVALRDLGERTLLGFDQPARVYELVDAERATER